MCVLLRIASELPGGMSDWRLMTQDVGATMGLADPEVSFLSVIWTTCLI